MEGDHGLNAAIKRRNFSSNFGRVHRLDVEDEVTSSLRSWWGPPVSERKEKKGRGALAMLLGFCWAAISRACGGNERAGPGKERGAGFLFFFFDKTNSSFSKQQNKHNF